MTSKTLQLNELDGNSGFIINGIGEDDNSGFAVSNGGDLNNDGIDDIIIGAYLADPSLRDNAGATYVVFGKDTSFNSSLNLADLDGTNGFAIEGINSSDNSGFAVSNAGDVNGDGIGDLILGANKASPGGNNEAGESYVVFGKDTPFTSSLNLADLDGTNGFVINGIAANDNSGRTVSSVGDVNADGVDDIIIGARLADAGGNKNSGASYVVFGSKEGFDSSINLSKLNGNDGFVVNGIAAGDNSGFDVSGIGDINDDGVDDFVIGARLADANKKGDTGQGYVVFGSQEGFDSSLNLADLDGDNGFIIDGISANDWLGFSVSNAGDVNGDGISDVILGARFANPNENKDAGESYVIFGSQEKFAPVVDLLELDGTNGFVVNGIDAEDNSGFSVGSAGDFNNDGIDDIIIGAIAADPDGNEAAGETYVVFGSKEEFSSSINLEDLTSSQGLTIAGIDGGDESGIAVSGGGDVNADGIDDLIIGARSADPNGNKEAGETYVVFGRDFYNEIEGDELDNNLSGTEEKDRITGKAGDDLLTGAGGNDTILGNTGKDTLQGGLGADLLNGGEDSDILSGGADSDTLTGGNNVDILNGGAGDDSLQGDAGNDLINGGEGNDILTGGDGSDIFFLAKDGGEDVITDFEAGSDMFKLTGGLSVNRLEFIADEPKNTVIVWNNSNHSAIAIVNNIDVADISIDDFI